MTNLIEIKDFIQKIAQGITFAIGIDTQVIDINLVRVAGTVYKPIPENGGVVKRVIDSGEYAISTHVDKGGPSCIQCNQRLNCKELGYIHCPIICDNQPMGVMGLICYEQEQIEKVKDERRNLLNFIQSMCELIALKLKEEDVHRKEQSLYEKMSDQNQLLNQILDQISDGYILLDEFNKIRNINKKAVDIFKLPYQELIGNDIMQFISDPNFRNMILDEKVNLYEKIKIREKNFGTLFYKVTEGDGSVTKILNFKTIENLGSRIAGEAFRERPITFDDILGRSEQMTKLKIVANKVAKTMPNILLTGETGTGKEMFARAIHNASDRANNPFISINCAAIPMDLLESELFGYDEGAFTGAKRGGKIGKFEMANSGTIFLDEIGDMPFHLQVKLLRVIQERELERIGGNRPIRLNIRIISATNKDLEEMVEEGNFREDLYYRLNIFEIHLPSLRDRTGDIPVLIHYFINKYRSIFGVDITDVDKETMDILCNYRWKGNIRELENVVQYMISINVDNPTGVIGKNALPKQVFQDVGKITCQNNLKQNLKSMEYKRIWEAVQRYGDTTQGKKLAAEELNISLATLYRKIKEVKKD